MGLATKLARKGLKKGGKQAYKYFAHRAPIPSYARSVDLGAEQIPADGPLSALQQSAIQFPAAVPGQLNADFSSIIYQKLHAIVASNNLQVFYARPALEVIAQQMQALNWSAIEAEWQMPVDLALDLCGLALYDVVVLCDDSSSMQTAEGGTRIQDLRVILSKVVSAATLFNANGVALRATNFKGTADNVRHPDQAAQYMAQFQYDSSAPLRKMLEKRIVEPMLETAVKKEQLQKPLLVITVTDGEPSRVGKVQSTVADAKKLCKKSKFGEGAVAFAFAQVGKDEGAQWMLESLDSDKDVGQMVDCTMNFEKERADCANQGIPLTADMWMLKLMVGGFDKSYGNID